MKKNKKKKNQKILKCLGLISILRWIKTKIETHNLKS